MRNFETDTIGQPLPLSYSLPAKPTRVPNWIAWPLILVMICVTFGPMFMRPNRTDDARIAAAKQDISVMTSALDKFEEDVGRYPATAEGLAALSSRPAGSAKWNGPYVAKPTINDPWMHRYIYVFPGTHTAGSFDLSSNGKNGKPGDADDIANWQNQ
ncbi:MAG TPA: type II secretion system protein GspG [Humisphaera sp.]|jgi:general secretion pathway protein G|nr:type II secretion system protein GspG [Humisphaera sp.]